MFEQDFLKKIMKQALSRGGDYCDIFIEDRDDTVISFDNGKTKSISTGKTAGIGIRVIYGKDFVYLFSSDPQEQTLLDLAKASSEAVHYEKQGTLIDFSNQFNRNIVSPKILPNSIALEKKVELVKGANQAARDHSSLIKEVMVNYHDHEQQVTIANSDGNFIHDKRVRSRFLVSAIAKKNGVQETGYYGPGRSMGWEFFDHFSPDQIAKEAARIALVRLEADYAPQGKMPVVIGNEFGGVIFHEACGHGLEATAVANDASVFCSKYEKQIANKKVSAVDDGTIPQAWGSAEFDDEGNPTQRNQLIKDGILTSYMIDKLGSIKMNMTGTNSSRRESYKYPPTSRMTNTYIDKGEDSFNDMISSIDRGVYCKKMGGGSVNPPTSDFNFSVLEGYLIKNGKIDRPLKGASLIGKGSEILMNIEMVGDDLDYNGTGMCGSASGSIPANVGQPSIKVSGLVIGGRK